MTSRTNPGSRGVGSTERRTVTVAFPLPPRELSPNGKHGDYRGHAFAVAAYRDACWGEVRKEIGIEFGEPMEQARISITFQYGTASDSRLLWYVRNGYAPIDVCNAISAVKPLIDSFVIARVLRDDSAKNLELAACQIRGLAERQKRDACGAVIVVLNETSFRWC